MATFTPRVPVFCIVRARWYSTVDVFDGRDWLVKAFVPWFVEAAGPATVPLVETGPKPPAEGGHAAPVPDPRMDQVLARLAALETTSPGGGTAAPDPRVDGLVEKLAALEGTIGETDKAAKAASVKAEEAAGKATQAESKAIGAQNIARQATSTVSQVKRVTDQVGPLKLHESYAQVKANAEKAVNDSAAAKSTAESVRTSVESSQEELLTLKNGMHTLQSNMGDLAALAEEAKSNASGAKRDAAEANKKAQKAASDASTANLSANQAVKTLGDYVSAAPANKLGELLRAADDGLLLREHHQKQLENGVSLTVDELNGFSIASAKPNATLWLWENSEDHNDQPVVTLADGQSALLIGDGENVAAMNLQTGIGGIFVAGVTVTSSNGDSGTLWVARSSTKPKP